MRMARSTYLSFRHHTSKDQESPRSSNFKEDDLQQDNNEPLLQNNVDRFTLFPIVDHDVSSANIKPFVNNAAPA